MYVIVHAVTGTGAHFETTFVAARSGRSGAHMQNPEQVRTEQPAARHNLGPSSRDLEGAKW